MKIEILTFEEAQGVFKNHEMAIKDTLTNTIYAKVDKYLLSVISLTNRYTLSDCSHWDLDIIFNPKSVSYVKNKAFMLNTKDLREALNMKGESLVLTRSEFLELCLPKFQGNTCIPPRGQLFPNNLLKLEDKTYKIELLGDTVTLLGEAYNENN